MTTDFPAPVDSHTIPNRGVVYVTTLPEECRRRDLDLLQGTTVTLGGKPFRVRGVESRCVDCQLKGWPIGLLGEYLGDIPGTRPLTPDDVEEMNRTPMSELYKCVIKPNVRTIEMRSLPVELKPGHHWIVDGEGKKPDVVILAPGTQCIESFTMGPEGHLVVNETLIAGVGTIMGPLPAPGPDGAIRVEMPAGTFEATRATRAKTS